MCHFHLKIFITDTRRISPRFVHSHMLPSDLCHPLLHFLWWASWKGLHIKNDFTHACTLQKPWKQLTKIWTSDFIHSVKPHGKCISLYLLLKAILRNTAHNKQTELQVLMLNFTVSWLASAHTWPVTLLLSIDMLLLWLQTAQHEA